MESYWKIEDVCNDPKIFLFHQICAMIIIFKTNHKSNWYLYPYYYSTDEFDKARVFVVLANNTNRILDIANTNKNKSQRIHPLCTECTNFLTCKKGITVQKMAQYKW